MSASATRAAFDQNDPKYKCLCGMLHIRKGARVVAVLTNVFTAINIIFSFTRTSTVFFYTLMSAAFSIVIFGSLLFGTLKEKRIYLLPYLFFQLISLFLNLLILVIFLISLGAHTHMAVDLAMNIGNVNDSGTQAEMDQAMASFTVLFILFIVVSGLFQAYFLDVIYSFYQFLKDRESSFSFSFDPYSTASYNGAVN